MTSKESFDNAASCIVPFGKYRGDKIEEVADTDMRYLVWMATECNITSLHFKESLTIFMNDPAVMQEIRQRKIKPRS